MKIIVLATISSVFAVTSLAGLTNENGQKQEMPAGLPPGIIRRIRAREQLMLQQYKKKTIANEQGHPQMKIETSARKQGLPGVAYAMQDKQRMTEGPPAEDEEEAIQEENNDIMEDLANAEQRELSWPYGRYAMPRPISGCPSGWSTGARFQDNEDISNTNSASPCIDMLMNVAVGSSTRIGYCVKISAGSVSSGSWPSGRYCIARKGGSCPTGFTSGSVYWDDEDLSNDNSNSGTLPDGTYDTNTKIYFCCRANGSTSIPISLPMTSPFILYRFGTTCQRVAGMNVRDLYILTDDENTFNGNSCTGSHPAGSCGRNIRINFCYYYKYY